MLLDERVRRFALASPMPEICARITQDPGFQAPNGQFDRQRFIELLRNAGFTEQRFVAEQRRTMLRSSSSEPSPARRSRLRPWSRRRIATRTSSAPSSMCCSTAPGRRRGGTCPRRAVAVFRTAQGAVPRARISQGRCRRGNSRRTRRWIEISDEDLKRAYEERKSASPLPSAGRFQQIVFPKADDARAASERIAKGETFEAIAKERGLAERTSTSAL